jgi:hypothetical protein
MLGERPPTREPRISGIRRRRHSGKEPISGKFRVETPSAQSKPGMNGGVKNFEGLGLQPLSGLPTTVTETGRTGDRCRGQDAREATK